MTTRLSLSVTSDDPEVIARATEHFARTATGLALDGMDCIFFAGPCEEECEYEEAADDATEAEEEPDA